MNALQALDDLRQEIVKGLESKLHYHAPDAAIEMRQKVKRHVHESVSLIRSNLRILVKDVHNCSGVRVRLDLKTIHLFF